jgi:hypothetical protein
MKKFFKVLTITGTICLVVVIALGIFIFNQLPSVSQIGQMLKSKPEATEPVQPVETESTGLAAASGDNSEVSQEEFVEAEDESDDVENSTIKEAMVADLLSPQKPLSDFCSSLKNAKDGVFEKAEFGQAFNQSLDEDKRDPRIQAVKPMLRYVMRLPKMTDMIQEAQAAVERNDEGFLQKAEFYSKAVKAFGEMKEHKSDIESVMDRSYLLLGLNKLLAKKPELLNDSRLQNYCGGVELSFNQGRPVDYENEKKDFLRFLDDVGANAQEIGFDPNYKSNVNFNFSGRALTFEGGWLSDLVKSDVDMEADLKKTN